MPATRVNPHRADALTADSVRPGMTFACWSSDGSGPARYYTAITTPTQDADGYMVIEVKDLKGSVYLMSTGDVGLTCDPHSGQWSTVAIMLDPESEG